MTRSGGWNGEAVWIRSGIAAAGVEKGAGLPIWGLARGGLCSGGQEACQTGKVTWVPSPRLQAGRVRPGDDDGMRVLTQGEKAVRAADGMEGWADGDGTARDRSSECESGQRRIGR